MKVGLYTTAFEEPSITHGQLPPESFTYWDPADPDVDCLLATYGAAWQVDMQDSRFKVLWRQEAAWLMPDIEPTGWNLILSHDRRDCESGGAIYVPLVGTWLQVGGDTTKTEMVSMVASSKLHDGVEGYDMRHRVKAKMGARWRHGFGTLFGKPIEQKDDALNPYRFSIAVESQKYPWYHSEKLFDCFAAKAVPLYWGCDDFTKLAEWGYDPAGILPWTTPEELAHLVGSLSVERYEAMRAAIETNYKRTWEHYCTEVVLETILSEALCVSQ